MDDVVSPSEKQIIISSFLEITAGQSTETAIQFLQATSWKLDEAIQLFYVGNEGGHMVTNAAPDTEHVAHATDQNIVESMQAAGAVNVGNEDEVRAPLPVIREALYDDAMLYGAPIPGYPAGEASAVSAFRNFNEEMRRAGVWEPDQGSVENVQDNLASLYRPPFDLMYQGPFEQAKVAASVQDKWLLVNLQSAKEFSSHMLNRDTWANEAVAQTVKTNFIFWQVYDDSSEGRKVCTYYKVDTVPVVLVIDPITGQKMRSWIGMIHPESLLEDLLQFLDGGPKAHHVSLSHKRPRESYLVPHRSQVTPVSADESNSEDQEMQRALAASLESMSDVSASTPEDGPVTNAEEDGKSSKEKLVYPSLPEEPKGDKTLLCRVGVRLPDGRRVQRNFLRSDPIQLLWSFCCSIVREAKTRPFHLANAIPGAAKSIECESKLTFEESGLANSMISMTWDWRVVLTEVFSQNRHSENFGFSPFCG